MKLIGNRIAVKANEIALTTASGIMLPEQAREKSCEGVIVEIGHAVKVSKKCCVAQSLNYEPAVPIDIKIGDHVLYRKFGGQELTIEGQELVVLEVQEIIAILDK